MGSAWMQILGSRTGAVCSHLVDEALIIACSWLGMMAVFGRCETAGDLAGERRATSGFRLAGTCVPSAASQPRPLVLTSWAWLSDEVLVAPRVCESFLFLFDHP